MKKKAALLLAFVMIFSLLPMNVFGSLPGTTSTAPELTATTQLIELHIPYHQGIAGVEINRIGIRVDLHGGNAQGRGSTWGHYYIPQWAQDQPVDLATDLGELIEISPTFTQIPAPAADHMADMNLPVYQNIGRFVNAWQGSPAFGQQIRLTAAGEQLPVAVRQARLDMTLNAAVTTSGNGFVNTLPTATPPASLLPPGSDSWSVGPSVTTPAGLVALGGPLPVGALDTNFAELNEDVIATMVGPQFGGSPVIDAGFRWVQPNGRSAVVGFDSTDTTNFPTIATLQGTYNFNALAQGLTIVLPLRIQDAGAEISATLLIDNNEAGYLITRRPVTTAVTGNQLNITAGDARPFTTDLLLPQISIAEVRNRVFGENHTNLGADMTNWVYVTLEAPRDFAWGVNQQWGAGGLHVASLRGTFTGFNPLGRTAVQGRPVAEQFQHWTNDNGIRWRTTGRAHATDIDVLILAIPTARLVGAPFDTLQINGLWLRPDARALSTGNVYVNVNVGTANNPSGTGQGSIAMNNGGGPLAVGNTSGLNRFNVTGWNDLDTPGWAAIGGRSATLHVGTRGAASLNFEASGDPLEVRTGTLGASRWIGGATRQRGGVETQRARLSEVIPGSWNSTFTNATEFRFNDPGVRILGAEVRAWHGGSDFNANNRIIPDTTVWLTQTSHVFEVQGQGGTDQGGRIEASPNHISVWIPTEYRDDRFVTRTHHMDIRFFLSVEAGYEDKHGREIEVTVSGGAVTNLSGGTASAVVAYAVDPIAVSVSSPVVPATTGTLYNVARQPISDIVITETAAGNLDIGQEIWLYVIGDTRRQQDLTLLVDAVATINPESGLVLREARPLRHAHANFWLDGVVFEVERRSTGTEPAVITITGANVSGTAFPGVNYSVVVSGTAVADNDFEVFSSRYGIGAGAQLEFMNVGTFATDPYAREVLVFDAGGVWGEVEGPGQAPGQAPGQGGRPIATRPNQNFVAGQLVPTVQAAGNTTNVDPIISRNGVNFIANRVFANFIDAEIHWVGETQTVSVVGYDADGVSTTVVLTIGQNWATINGAPVDIADFSRDPVTGTGSGPHGTIAPFMANGSSYLPVRFLVRAFGMDTDILWQQGVPGVTLGW